MNDKFKIGDLVKIKTTSRSKYKEAIGIFENYCKGRNLEICRVRLWRNKVIQICDYNLEKLYEEGYRKASDVATEIFEEIEKIIDKHYKRHIFGVEELSDVEQEAVMNFSGDVTYDIAELKKKYTEGENGKQRN